MEALAKTDVTAAHSLFIETLLPIVEELVPMKIEGKRFGKRKVDKERRSLWKRLGRVRKRLLSTTCISKAASLLLTKQRLEKELKRSYDTKGSEDEKKVVQDMKSNPKAFFAFGRARQKTKSRVGPFLDPGSGIPNSDPDFAARLLSEQYSSVFT